MRMAVGMEMVDVGTLCSYSYLMVVVAVALGLVSIYAVVENVVNGLRKLPPGPRGLPILGNLLDVGSNPHQSLYRLSQRHGDLMHIKLGFKDMVVASSVRTATAILKTYDHMLCNRPDAGLAFDILTYNRSNITMGPDWQLLRKVCHLPMFSAASLEKWQLIREGEIASVTASIFHLHQHGKPADIAELAHAFTLNIIGQMVFHTRIGDKQEAFQFKRDVDHFLRLFGGFRIGDFVPCLSWTNLGGSPAEMHQVLSRIDGYFVKKLQELEQKKHKEKALIQVLQAQAEEGRISDVNVKGIVLDMLLAGTDTASKSIEWAMTELIRHPEVMERLQEEIDGVVGQQETIVRESYMGRMNYLKAVVKETLRLHPPTPLMLPHAAPSKGCCPVLGYTIPKGSRVVVNVWAVGRDPLRWQDPLKFDPTRFMEESIDVLHAQDFGVIPFGAGRRMCPGRNLGFRMVELAVANLVHSFKWSLPMGQNPKNLDMSEIFGVSVSKAVSLQGLGIPRLPHHLYTYSYSSLTY